MPLTLIYKHNHDCTHKDEVVEDRPGSNNGVAWIVIPTCEETMTELALIKSERY